MKPPEHRTTSVGLAFWKIAGAGGAFRAGSAAVNSATIVHRTDLDVAAVKT